MPSKTDEIARIDAARDRFLAVVRPVDDAHGTWQGAFGTWSLVNVLQHLGGWFNEMTPALERLARGERPTPDGVDYSNDELWNAKFVEVAGEQSMAEAIASLESSLAAFRAAVESVPDERFGDNKTANRLVDGVVIRHFDEHAEEITEWLAGSH